MRTGSSGEGNELDAPLLPGGDAGPACGHIADHQARGRWEFPQFSVRWGKLRSGGRVMLVVNGIAADSASMRRQQCANDNRLPLRHRLHAMVPIIVCAAAAAALIFL